MTAAPPAAVDGPLCARGATDAARCLPVTRPTSGRAHSGAERDGEGRGGTERAKWAASCRPDRGCTAPGVCAEEEGAAGLPHCHLLVNGRQEHGSEVLTRLFNIHQAVGAAEDVAARRTGGGCCSTPSTPPRALLCRRGGRHTADTASCTSPRVWATRHGMAPGGY